MDRTETLLVASNRKARRDFTILETFEAGLVLRGAEVKSLRAHQVQMADAYARFGKHDAWLEGVHIPKYSHGTYINHEPERTRKLLLHRDEIRELGTRSRAQGYTIVPLRLYFKGGRAKLEVGVAKGRRLYDKRQAIAERESKREIARTMRASR